MLSFSKNIFQIWPKIRIRFFFYFEFFRNKSLPITELLSSFTATSWFGRDLLDYSKCRMWNSEFDLKIYKTNYVPSYSDTEVYFLKDFTKKNSIFCEQVFFNDSVLKNFCFTMNIVFSFMKYFGMIWTITLLSANVRSLSVPGCIMM